MSVEEPSRWLRTVKWTGKDGQPKGWEQGKKVGNVMQKWREARRQKPELFQGVRAWGQSEATMDSVISHWLVEVRKEEDPEGAGGIVVTDLVSSEHVSGSAEV